jgi:uncharacterized protein DUF4255
MIKAALILLREELRAYLASKGDSTDVILENIALLETSDASNLDQRIIISLVNIEEESTLKNTQNFLKTSSSKGNYSNSPVYLNLYLLVTANYTGGDSPKNNYLLALSNLSFVISFFQGKNSFAVGSSQIPNILDFYDAQDKQYLPDLLDMKITMELYTLTFEQINHLWGSLGGRQVPFAMYKARLVMITDRNIVRQVPLVEEIRAHSVPITNN